MMNNVNVDDSSVLEASANLLELATSKDLFVAEKENISTMKLTDAQFRALYLERFYCGATKNATTALDSELSEPSLLSVRNASVLLPVGRRANKKPKVEKNANASADCGLGTGVNE